MMLYIRPVFSARFFPVFPVSQGPEEFHGSFSGDPSSGESGKKKNCTG
jgi:hypothetical protein